MIDPHQADAPFILTLDLGSSSTRALLFDAQARTIKDMDARETVDFHTAADGTAEDDPTEALARVVRVIDALLEKAGALAAQIAAVAVSTFASTLMVVDKNYTPLTPLLVYADTRSHEDAVMLREALDEEAIQARTGGLLRSSYWLPRLAWLRRTQPHLWESAAYWLTLGEYIEWCLFGKCRVSFSVASWGGLLAQKTLTWDAELLAHVGMTPDHLSPLVDHDAPLQGLRPEYAQRWAVLDAIPWFPAIGDGAAANIGSGAIGEERIALTVGTTSAVRVALREVERIPQGLWCYRITRELTIVGGATSEGGNIFAWLSDTLQLGDPNTLEARLAALPPDGHGLTVLPFLAGERSPGWAGKARGTLHGVTLDTTPLEILQAHLEAITYRCALIAERLPLSSDIPHRFVASGGALSESPSWMQRMADAFGYPIIASKEAEASSRGVALLALVALGVLRDVMAIPATDGDLYTPNPVATELYRHAIARQTALYEKLIG